MNEIVKQKRYTKPDSFFCGNCPHCLHFTHYNCEQHYCLVDDEYKFNDYPEEKDCPFKEQKFKIGDDVWIALAKVLKANIKDISHYKNGEIKYFCHYYDGGIGFVPEKEIFATKAEAQAECNRRNNETKI